MSGNSGDDARLDSVHPSPDGAVVGPTGAGEMVCPQAAHRASIAGGPVFQRPVIKIVEDLYEVQHERRMVKARGFSDLVERYELVELGEPIFVVDDGRNKAPTRAHRANRPDEAPGHVCAELEGAASGLALDRVGVPYVVAARRQRRRRCGGREAYRFDSIRSPLVRGDDRDFLSRPVAHAPDEWVRRLRRFATSRMWRSNFERSPPDSRRLQALSVWSSCNADAGSAGFPIRSPADRKCT